MIQSDICPWLTGRADLDWRRGGYGDLEQDKHSLGELSPSNRFSRMPRNKEALKCKLTFNLTNKVFTRNSIKCMISTSNHSPILIASIFFIQPPLLGYLIVGGYGKHIRVMVSSIKEPF